MTDQELHYRFALYGDIAFRLFLRMFIGKKRRDEFFNKKKIRVSTFFIYSNKIIKKNGIKAYVRRNSDDYELLFLPREQELLPHVKLQKNEIFLDIGANVGYYTLKSLTENPENLVISIEAHPRNFNALRKNVFEVNNFKNAILINKAAYHSKKKIKIYERGGWSGVPSIYANTDTWALVECDTVDNILKDNKVEKANVIKIDVEGAEIDVLQGITQTLKHCRKIIVEIHEKNLDKVVSILSKNNFKIDVLKITDGEYVIGTKNSFD